MRRAGWLVALVLVPAAGLAQPTPPAGPRALAMAGAFVGLADDASAPFWNPAGVGLGPVFSVAAGYTWTAQDRNRLVDRLNGRVAPPLDPDARQGVFGGDSIWWALSTPVIAFSFERLHLGDVQPIAAPVSGREDPRLRFRALALQYLGLTLVNGVGSGAIILGTTVKIARGGGAISERIQPAGTGAAGLIEVATALKTSASTTVDLDLGLMATLTPAVRLGAVVWNLRQPSFRTSGGNPIRLKRRARLGLAVLPSGDTAVTFDIDLTRGERDLARADGRTLAVGAEQWLLAHRIALRGGVRRGIGSASSSTPVFAAGGAIRLGQRLRVDLAGAAGRHRADRQWTAGLGYAF